MQDSLSNFKRFLERRYPGRSTTKHYMSDLAIFSEYMDELSLREISAKKIDVFVQWQSDQGLKAATINRRLSAISSFFDYQISEAEDDGWQNPVYWKRHSVRQGHRLPRDVNDATVEQLFSVIDKSRDRAMFTLMVRAGLRGWRSSQLEIGRCSGKLQLDAHALASLWQRRKGTDSLAHS